MNVRILVIDDEESWCEILKYNLEKEGFDVDTADSAETALGYNLEVYNLMIVDIMMEHMSGFDFAKRVRNNPNPVIENIPIIFCSAMDGEDDLVKGLNIGADDYITKPFNILEVKARIRALLRRSAAAARPAEEQRSLLTVGDLALDTQQRVAIRDGQVIDLTAKEYDLMELLMKNPRRVYSRESLMDLVWGYSYAGDYRTVDVHIRRLREKLEKTPAEPVYIMTKWGVGYYFKGESQPTI